MATTPLKRPLYTLGKWLSNFAVLGAMVVILMVVAGVMQLLYREDLTIQWWPLVSPFLLLVLPFMAFTASLAVLFETIAWLRGGLGNVIYFFLFIMVIVVLGVLPLFGASPFHDFIGIGILNNSMGQAVKAVYPTYEGGFRITWLVPEFQTFRWDGITWTLDIVFSRLALLLVSFGIAVLSAVFFDRFNPSRARQIKGKKTAMDLPEIIPTIEPTPTSDIHLTPLSHSQELFRFDALFVGEMKLFMKGQQWWWYCIAAGLVVAQLFTPLDITRVLLALAWIWHILLLSRLGCRENIFDTRQTVFSAPHPILNQLPAAWLAAFVVTILLGSGALMRFLSTGETFSILGWLTGAFFIPSFALACGTLTGTNKAFEVLFVLWMYMAIQKVPLFDFVGMTPVSPLYIYAPLTLVLLAISVFARQQQIKSGGTSR